MIKKTISFLIICIMAFSIVIPNDIYALERDYTETLDINTIQSFIDEGQSLLRVLNLIKNIEKELIYKTIDIDFNPKTVKILAIGNSFSEDAAYWLYDIAKSAGVDVIVGNVYFSGCSLKTHWNNASNNNATYTYYKWTSSTMEKLEKQTMKSCILDERWDFITFQQASPDSGIYSTFQPYLNNLIGYTKGISRNKNVKLALNMTWAYAENSTNENFETYNSDQKIMYNSIINSYKQASFDSNIDIIIPCATAIQNARTNSLLRAVGNELTLDGYHLEEDIGRYIAGLTYFETLIVKNWDKEKKDINDVTFMPNINDNNKELVSLVKNVVNNAVLKPYTVTRIDK
ncbi:hypothetical protein J2Z76_001899 [Sedimentibacter acidaminivorans]|uniref:DUF4886 domain-containing protein n=1 Tax=Sedimentibacter acidaminivorans TaxID=913099 RepID=A0ABS4GEB0_9FIRM|nr:DUF4886 domain-containing protein [Sedimentibacter acidaminivorans]MBP1926035.1 hypothetical protein [Sedimentibacter acidaminivorans]